MNVSLLLEVGVFVFIVVAGLIQACALLGAMYVAVMPMGTPPMSAKHDTQLAELYVPKQRRFAWRGLLLVGVYTSTAGAIWVLLPDMRMNYLVLCSLHVLCGAVLWAATFSMSALYLASHTEHEIREGTYGLPVEQWLAVRRQKRVEPQST